MSYTEYLINKEIHILETCLSEWDLNNYPEARKEREIRLKDLKNSLLILSKHKIKLQSPN